MQLSIFMRLPTQMLRSFRCCVDEDLEDSIKVTVIATGFDGRNPVTVNPGRPKSNLLYGSGCCPLNRWLWMILICQPFT